MESGFQQVHPKSQKNKAKYRAFIGNLRSSPDLKSRLLLLFQENSFDIQEKDILVQKKQKSCFALVSYKNVGKIVSRLNGVDFDGRKILVQHEQANKVKGSKKAIFGGSWSGPVQSHVTKKTINETTNDMPGKNFICNKGGLLPHSEIIYEEDMKLEDFHARCKKPFSELIQELGDRDPDFKNFKPSDILEKKTSEETISPGKGVSRLGKHGKAPLHVEFRSFGYIYGAPSSQGWSHAQPLPPLDCRSLPAVEPYLLRQDGKSFSVKKALNTNELNALVTHLTDNVVDALAEAINDGHGYALPLQMTISVGSELGRHRSMLVCENAAKQLRSCLRRNCGDRIRQDVSVGTYHPDTERAKRTKEIATHRRNCDEFEKE